VICLKSFCLYTDTHFADIRPHPYIVFPSSLPCPQPPSNVMAVVKFSHHSVSLNTLAGHSTPTAIHVTVRQTALLCLSYGTVTKVVLLNLDQLGPQLVSDFGWMWITRSMIRFVGPYGDGVGLNTLAELVITELSL
jgi:hypothetical protein